MKLKNKPAYLAILLVSLAACGPSPEDKAAAQLKMDIAVKKRLVEIAGQANQAAPANIDDNTRLDSAKAGPGLKLTTTYTLLNPDSQGISSATFDSKLKPVVTSGSCKNGDLRPLIDRGVVVVLDYRGPDGKPMGTINVDRAACVALKE